MQLQQLQFYGAGGEALVPSAVRNPGGDNPHDEGPVHAGRPGRGKWLDQRRRPLVFRFAAPVTPVSYELATGNDCPGRDPVRWTIEGRRPADGGPTPGWQLLADASAQDQPVPFSRRASSARFVSPSPRLPVSPSPRLPVSPSSPFVGLHRQGSSWAAAAITPPSTPTPTRRR